MLPSLRPPVTPGTPKPPGHTARPSPTARLTETDLQRAAGQLGLNFPGLQQDEEM